ncbi:MAG: ComF family protein [Fimbriimonas sp.]
MLLDRLLDWVYPPRCSLCERFGPDSPCDRCLGLCTAWESKELPLMPVDYAHAIFNYDGPAMEAVKALKYARKTALAKRMAALIRDGYDTLGHFPDAIVPVPIHWRRRCQRGFNQAEMLAEALPADLVRPRLLVRTRATRPQVGLTTEQRLLNLVGAFGAGPLVPAHVMLIDDVYTSGQTARECAKALKAGGAKTVGILCFASG